MPPKKAKSLPYPPPLKKGGTIGIIAPSRTPHGADLIRGQSLLEARGYKVKLHPQNELQDGQLAGSDQQRAEAIMEMFCDPEIDAILCSRGGTGALRLLDKLDYKAIRKNPKPFVGFSDITALLQSISRRAGFVTFHGPMLWSFGRAGEVKMLDDMLHLIGNTKKTFRLSVKGVDIIRPGRAEGMLTGGNISLLQFLIGTPFDWQGQDNILFLEDCEEVYYKLDEKLRHFRLAGKFEKCRAVIIGEMIDIKDGETGFARRGEKPYGRDFKQIVLENVPAKIPLCMNFPCGHGPYLATLPVGSKAKLILKDGTADLTF